MKLSLPLLLLTATSCVAELETVKFAGRHFIPGGPEISGFGFAALENTYYDSSEHLFYGSSEEGYLTVSDYSEFPDSVSTPVSLQIDNQILDLAVCGDHLFVVTRGELAADVGNFHVFSKSKKGTDGSLSTPEEIVSVSVGYSPRSVILNSDCSLAAVANSGHSYFDETNSLVNVPGSISLIAAPFDDSPVVTPVLLDEWEERELRQKRVNLPLTADSMTYWSNILKEDFDTAAAIAEYEPAHVLSPKSLAFSSDESMLYVNLQVNNAFVKIDITEGKAVNVVSFGTKKSMPVDVVDDGGCDTFEKVDGLEFLRSPDGIAALNVNGTEYLVTANEGFSATIGPFKEAVEAGEIFAGNKLGFPEMSVDTELFDPSDITVGTSAPFNQDCDDSDPDIPFCSPGLQLSVGSVAIDYRDPSAPIFKSMVAIGGRGVTVYEVTDDGLKQRWDSGRGIEIRTCNQFPYAHNGEQDALYAPVDGPFYDSLDNSFRAPIDERNDPDVLGCLDGGDGNPGACSLSGTVDRRSLIDGPAPEAIAYGEACGTPYMVTATEKSSIAFIYSMVNPAKAQFDRAFALSPISEVLNPGLAYANRSIGEIDPENIQFLSEEESPTGNAAVIFAGAVSGTASIYEFICVKAPTVSPAPTQSPVTSVPACDHPVCHVCGGSDMEVKKPDVMIPEAGDLSCAEIQEGGLGGCVPADLCGASASVLSACECGMKEGAAATSTTMAPTATPGSSTPAPTAGSTPGATFSATETPASGAKMVSSFLGYFFTFVGLLWI